MIPQRLELGAIQEAFRQMENDLNALRAADIDMGGRRVIRAGVSVDPSDYVTRGEVDAALGAVIEAVKAERTELSELNIPKRGGFPRISIKINGGVQVYDKSGNLVHQLA